MADKRVGVVIPSLNTLVEDDLRRYLPADVGYHITRVRLSKTGGRVTQEELLAAGREAVQLSTLLSDARMDAIAFNCTGASLSNGIEGANKLREDIEAATNTASTTTILSVVRALRAAGLKRIVHVCPFTAEFGADEANFLRASGFDVVVSKGLNFTDARVAAKMMPEEIVAIALDVDHPDADGIFLACANVRAMEATETLQRKLGKPVITSNQAVIWDLLDMIKHPAAAKFVARAPATA
ncbi:MAG: aspartate/glutamate racemase family protein [Caulobacterales bacterium]|nr:aspartate/glutamate racemase family protein [Caulobacterales bacterium]